MMKPMADGEKPAAERNGAMGCSAVGMPPTSSMSMPPSLASAASRPATPRPTVERAGSSSGRNTCSWRAPRLIYAPSAPLTRMTSEPTLRVVRRAASFSPAAPGQGRVVPGSPDRSPPAIRPRPAREARAASGAGPAPPAARTASRRRRRRNSRGGCVRHLERLEHVVDGAEPAADAFRCGDVPRDDP